MTFKQYRVLRILNQMRKANQPFSDNAVRNHIRDFDRDEFLALCKDLNTKGYFERFKVAPHGDILEMELSYKGMCFRQNFAVRIVSGCFHWFSEHILELVALILSLIALLRC